MASSWRLSTAEPAAEVAAETAEETFEATDPPAEETLSPIFERVSPNPLSSNPLAVFLLFWSKFLPKPVVLTVIMWYSCRKMLER